MLDVRFFANARFSAASVNVTLVFFALFGFIFLATQYLQFVLGYSAFDAGVRTLPFAVALMVMAPLSSKTVQWFGTKRVVVTGMLVFAVRPRGGVDRDGDVGLPAGDDRDDPHGDGHGPVGRARHRVDHGLTAAPPGRASAPR